MSNQSKVTSASQLNSVIFKSHASDPVFRRFFTLFPGLGYAAVYKVLQRIYKYGGQPFVRDYLATNHGAFFDQTFGRGNGKAMMHATAGSLIGIGEIVLLPLDVLKIKSQTNPEAFRGRGIFRLVKDEGFALYRGWGWTAARNAPGSFALFGGSAAAKQYLFKLDNYNSATWFQNFVASISGSAASLIVSAPLDVVKTRIQNQNFEVNKSGMQIIGYMARHEGPSAFFKGLVPKLLMTGPKLTCVKPFLRFDTFTDLCTRLIVFPSGWRRRLYRLSTRSYSSIERLDLQDPLRVILFRSASRQALGRLEVSERCIVAPSR